MPVTTKADAVWKLRRRRDIYTNRPRCKTTKPEVDHVIEIQLHEAIYERVIADGHVAARTRGAMERGYRALVNDVPYLNVTTMAVNRAKEGPFRAFKNRYTAEHQSGRRLRGKTLEDFARASTSEQMRRMVDEGVWANITTAVVRTWDAMQEEVPVKVSNAAMSDRLVDEMQAMLSAMDI